MVLIHLLMVVQVVMDPEQLPLLGVEMLEEMLLALHLLQMPEMMHLQIPVLEEVVDMLPVHLHQLMGIMAVEVVPVLS